MMAQPQPTEDAVREQARAVLSLVQGFAGTDAGADGDCSWCPLCRAARAVRDGRPDVALEPDPLFEA